MPATENLPRRLGRAWFFAPLALFLALFIGSIVNSDFMRFCLDRLTIYILYLVFAAWAAALVRLYGEIPEAPLSLAKRHGPGIAAALVLSALIIVSTKPMFRIAGDEHYMLGISRSMTFEKRTEFAMEAHNYYGIFSPISRNIADKNMGLPFVTNLVNVVSDSHYWNPFVVNYFMFAALLFFAFALFRERFGLLESIAGMVVVASQPVIAQSAASAGYEMGQTTFLVASFLCLRRYLGKPTDAAFDFLLTNLVALAYFREESGAVFVLTVSLLFVLKAARFGRIRSSAVLSLCPLLLLPFFWQLAYNASIGHAIGENVYVGGPAFSFNYFVQHNLFFLQKLFQFDFSIPHATPVYLLAIVLVAFRAVGYLQHPERVSGLPPAVRKLAVICAVNMAFLWTLHTAFWGGRIDHVVTSRYFTPYAAIFSMAAVRLLGGVLGNERKPILAAGALACLLLYHSFDIKTNYTNAYLEARLSKYCMDFLKDKGDNILVIVNRPQQFSARNYATMMLVAANSNVNDILTWRKNRLYREIYFFQNIREGDQKPMKDYDVDSRFVLKTEAEIQFTNDQYLRISRLVNPD